MIDSDSIVTRFWRECYNGIQWEIGWGPIILSLTVYTHQRFKEPMKLFNIHWKLLQALEIPMLELVLAVWIEILLIILTLLLSRPRQVTISLRTFERWYNSQVATGQCSELYMYLYVCVSVSVLRIKLAYTHCTLLFCLLWLNSLLVAMPFFGLIKIHKS